jgi:hypothetical protein
MRIENLPYFFDPESVTARNVSPQPPGIGARIPRPRREAYEKI